MDTPRPRSDSTFEPGELIAGRYRVTRELGRGGMATVYLADDTRLSRAVAVKVLLRDLTTVIGAERFHREIQVAAGLSHPNVVGLLDSGVHDDLLFYVMPYIEGETLRARLVREGPLPVAAAAQVVRDVARGLAFAHAHGVVHRDVKPENILLTGDAAVLTDFGIAKLVADSPADRLTETGLTLGTVAYMSPEQCSGGLEPLDGRSDVYALGCVMYEMLTGEMPHAGPTARSIIAKRLIDPVPRAGRLRDGVSEDLDVVVARAMARSPADRFETILSFSEAVTTAISQPMPAGRPDAPRAARRRRVLPLAIAGLLVAAIAMFAVWRGTSARSAEDASIAVLRFEDLTTGKAGEHLAAGIAEELQGALARVPGLRVAGRVSVQATGASVPNPLELGRRLGVATVLSGSVRREGERLRIGVELVSVRDGLSLWTQNYNRAVGDVFAVQEEIAQAIAGALRLRLGEGRQLVTQGTSDVAAYELYLRGRQAWSRRTPESLRQAIGYFRQAAERDPRFARAYAGLADTYAFQALNLYEPPSALFPLGKAAAERALAIDPELAEAHASLATVSYMYDLDWAVAEREYRRAIAIDSGGPDAHYFYSLFLTAMGRYPEALASAHRARRLDPLSPPIAMGFGISLLAAKRFADADTAFRVASTLDPDYSLPRAWRGFTLARLGGRELEAMAEADRAVELAPGNSLVRTFRGMTLAALGRRAEALHVADSLSAAGRSRPVSYAYIARIYAVLGEKERAFERLEAARVNREGQWPQLLNLGLDSLFREPRFIRLLTELGIDTARAH